MQRVGEVITTWPTLGFTFVLAFFLAWWILSLVVSGIDGTDVDADGDGINDDLFGKVGHFVGIGSVPLSLGLTLFSFGAWSTSLLASLVFQGHVRGGFSLGIGVASSLVALLAGSLFTRKFGAVFAPVFDFHSGPTRSDALGAKVKVRTLHVDDRFGEAEVVTGTRANSIVRVRAESGRFTRGDMAVLVDYDAEADTFSIAPLNEFFPTGESFT